MRPALVIAAAACASAPAIWLAPASVHIVSWDDNGPQRVALFAPLWQLALSGATTTAAAALLWLAPPRSGDARARRAFIVTPLIALFICTLPYLPWLPDRWPLLLVLAGPAHWVVIAAASGAVIMRAAPGTSTWRATIDRRVVFAISLAIYVAFGARSFATIGVKGDEPHYLIISQSLLADGDLLIENNHRRREYQAFTREELPPDFLQRGRNGEIYSIHAPGLPAMLLPVFAFAGAHGALLMLCLAGALAALAVLDLAALVAGPSVALLTWAAVTLTVPFVPYAWSIFPEMPGAAIVAWAALWIASPRDASLLAWFARGLALALLPWLHTKFVVFAAALTLLLIWQRRRNMASVSALLLPVAVSGAAWLTFFYVVYGTANPEAAYGTFARDWVKLTFVPRGILGLLLDQKFGLLIYAPIYLLALVGLWIAVRQSSYRWMTLTLASVAVLFTISSARLYMWWGGWSAPARFLVPAVPLLVPAMALAIERVRRTPLAWTITVLLSVSLATSLISAAVPGQLLLFSDAHGVSRLADAIQGSAPLTATLPMFTESEWQPRDLVPRAYLPRERLASAVRGRLTLLESFDTNRRAFDYSAWRPLQPVEWRAAGTLTAAIASSDSAPPLAPQAIYPEGDSFWTSGTERGRVLIAARGHGVIDVTVHVGPAGGICRTSVNGETRAESLQPNETRLLTFDGIPRDAAWVGVTVQASDAFRPADVDPETQDQRLLGCQVRVALR